MIERALSKVIGWIGDRLGVNAPPASDPFGESRPLPPHEAEQELARYGILERIQKAHPCPKCDWNAVVCPHVTERTR